MGKRGPKPSITYEQRLSELQKHDIFDKNGNVKKEGDPVWITICNTLITNNPGKSISPKTLQIYVSQNRCGILNALKSDILDAYKKSQDTDKEKGLLIEHSNGLSVVEEKLINLKSDALYRPSIKEICTFPFTIFQWSIEVFDVVSSLSNDVQYIFGVIGSFCEKFIAPDGFVSEKLFLYALGINVTHEFIPICQVTTEHVSVSLLTRFFRMCSKDGLFIPTKIAVDYVWSHYIAVNSAFNINMTYEKYLLECFAYLQRNSKKLPRSVIKTNVRFLIIEVMQWKCVANIKIKSVKYFYIYSVILLSKQNCLSDFEDLLKKIFAFFYRKFQSKISEELFNFIISKIKQLKIDVVFSESMITKIENEYKQFIDSESIKTINYQECDTIINYIKNIFVKAKEYIASMNDNNERNFYFNEDFCKNLIKLCTEFTMWSNVMCEDVDGYCTEDASIELIDNYKNNLNERLLGSKITADEFLKKNIDYVDEKIKVLRKSIPEKIRSDIKRLDMNKFENSYLLYEENWMGRNPQEKIIYSSESEEDSRSYISESDNQSDYDIDEENNSEIQFVEQSHSQIIESVCQELKNEDLNEVPHLVATVENNLPEKYDAVYLKQKKCKPRGKFLKPCAEIDLLHQKPTKVPKKRVVIKNYNSIKPKTVNKIRLSVLTSSFFDSVLEVLTSVYFNVSEFQSFISNTEYIIIEGIKYDFFLILHSYVTTLDITKLYTNRANFLSKVCTDEHNNKLCWTQTVGIFVEKIFYPNIFSKLLCLDCDTYTYQYFNCIKLPFKELLCENVGSAICNKFETESQILCEKCQKPLILYGLEVKNLLCIDVEDINEDCSVEFNNFSVSFSLGKQRVTLVGLIAYEKPIGHIKLRHYLAYCRNADGNWFKYDDIAQENKPIKTKIKKKCINVALAIYFAFESSETIQ